MNGSTLVSFRAIPQLGAWQNRIHWQKLTEPPLIENPAAFHLLPRTLTARPAIEIYVPSLGIDLQAI